MFKCYVVSKESLNNLIKNFRNMGFSLITYTDTIAELEKDNKLLVIQVRRKKGGVI